MSLIGITPEDIGLMPCPVSGQGCHPWIYHATRALVQGDATDEAITEWITHYLQRDPKPREISDTISRVRRRLRDGTPDQPGFRKIYPLDEARIDGLTAASPTTLEDIVARSPIDPATTKAGDVFQALFRPGERTIVFDNDKSQGQFVWHHRIPEQAIAFALKDNRAGGWFLLNPVTGHYAPADNKDGRSRRTEANTTAFRNVLIESDQLDLGLWLTILKQQALPIVSITLSGNASAHAILNLGTTDRESWNMQVAALAADLVPLGACPGSLTAVRLTRVPGVIRGDNGNEQTLIWFNPEAGTTPIGEFSKVR